jgi:E3 ubiquitin-protein ligase BRE1
MRKEKDLVLKAESVETARKMVDNSQLKIEELECQLQKAIVEKNEVEIKVEEAMQDSGSCP